MINAETIYQKATRLDTVHLQEVADFIDFLSSKAQPAEKPANASGEKENPPPSPLCQAGGETGLMGRLETDNHFWQPNLLSDYLQNRLPLRDIADLAADFWPEDESIDDFIAFVRQQRREDREQSQCARY